jgi:uncharacterized integral membrane protein
MSSADQTPQTDGPATAPGTSEPGEATASSPLGRTRLRSTWVVLAAALTLLLLLLVFILLNLQRVDVNFFGAHKHVPLAVALLLAGLFGAVLVFVIGTARILQIRTRVKRARSAPPS